MALGEKEEECRKESTWKGGGQRGEMRVYTCQETCRLVHGIGGPYGHRRTAGVEGQSERKGAAERGEERGWFERELRLGQGHKNVLSTPAPPVIGSNHRGSHVERSPTSSGRSDSSMLVRLWIVGTESLKS